eukprot:6291378-Karenia_brevis.AAC.1
MPYCKLNCESTQNANKLIKSFQKAHPVGKPWKTHAKNSQRQNITIKLHIARSEMEGEETRKTFAVPGMKSTARHPNTKNEVKNQTRIWDEEEDAKNHWEESCKRNKNKKLRDQRRKNWSNENREEGKKERREKTEEEGRGGRGQGRGGRGQGRGGD